jgi:tRNA(Ile)-lysidine synthase
MPGPTKVPPHRASPADRTLLTALERSLASPHPHAGPLLIALSGGPDSMALLDLAARLHKSRAAGFRHLQAAHIHHGLHPCAGAWQTHCERECAARAIPFHTERVAVDAGHRGIEAGAREARYAALARIAQSIHAHAVLTAHHLDDRIETFLLQWLRGAGPAGLAGIASERTLPTAGENPVRLLRPLLDIPRADLAAYCERHAIESVQDPSNEDTSLARNAMRAAVLPALARIRHGFRRSAARSIDLVAEAAEVLQELSREDLARCSEDAPGGMLRLDRLALLAPARQTATMRAWLQSQGVEAPSRARLAQALEQALGAAGDARMLVRMGERELRRYRGLLVLRRAKVLERRNERIVWRGEAEISVPAWGGALRILAAGEGEGLEPEWLRAEPLEFRARFGGERFKPHPKRPSKTLKQLFQEAGIPEFERAALPLIWREDRLLFVPGLGMDVRLTEQGPGRVRLEWVGEGELLQRTTV